MNFSVLILTLAIICGQLIRVPLGQSGYLNLLDVTVGILDLWALFQIKFKFKKPPLFLNFAFLFIAVAVISLIFTPLHLQSNQYLTSFFYTVRFSIYILLAWLLLLGALPDLRKNISPLLTVSGIILAVLGLLQFIFIPDLRFLQNFSWDPHYFRTVSTFLDPNFIGAFFVLTLLSLQRLPRPRRWLVLAMTITYLALLTTFSRSSYLMFLVSGITLAFLNRSKTLLFKTLTGFIILLLGFWFYVQLVTQPHNIDRTQSAAFRLTTWQQGLDLFSKNPFLGVGYNAYRFGIEQYNLGNEQFVESHGSTSNDSSLLSVLSTTGILGLIAFGAWLFFSVKYSRGGNLILISGIVGLLIHSFFANSLFYPPILLWIILNSVIPKT